MSTTSTSKYAANGKKSPTQKVVDSIVGQISSGIQGQLTSLTGDLSQTLFSLGQSFDSISAIASLKVDSVLAGGSNDYTGINGKCVERSSAASIRALFSGGSTGSYLAQVAPEGKIAAKTYADQQGVDVYPFDIGKYQMRFDFMTYQRPTPFQEATSDVNWSCVLTIPTELREGYGADWETGKLDFAGDIADAVGRNAGSWGDVGNQALQGGAAQLLRTSSGSRTILGSLTTAFEQSLGVTPNPNITVAFRGPKMRSHTLSWTFHPHSAEESRAIQKIIANIKSRMLPKATKTSQSILGYPDMVRVSLLPEVIRADGSKGPLYDFKTCVVSNFSVNYASQGAPAFFRGTNLPMYVSLTMELTEIEYFVDENGGEAFPTLKALGQDITSEAKKFLGLEDTLSKQEEGST